MIRITIRTEISCIKTHDLTQNYAVGGIHSPSPQPESFDSPATHSASTPNPPERRKAASRAGEGATYDSGPKAIRPCIADGKLGEGVLKPQS